MYKSEHKNVQNLQSEVEVFGDTGYLNCSAVLLFIEGKRRASQTEYLENIRFQMKLVNIVSF